MHGLGNDFIIIMEHKKNISATNVRDLCDRRLGIGCDQLFLVHENQLIIYNADGSRADLCINGIRCVAFLLYLKSGKREIELQVKERRLKCKVLQSWGCKGLVSVEVGKYNVKDFSYQNKTGLLVDVGNQHLIFIVDDPKQADMGLAAQLNGHGNSKDLPFINGINVSFVHVRSTQEVYLKVYERGVGETLACGSAACATYAGLYSLGIISQETKVSMKFSKGSLDLFMLNREVIMIEGDANLVAEGAIVYDI